MCWYAFVITINNFSFSIPGLKDKVMEYQQRYLARKRWMNAFRLACAVSFFQKTTTQRANGSGEVPMKPIEATLRQSKFVRTRESKDKVGIGVDVFFSLHFVLVLLLFFSLFLILY
jgi:hypothetical protein